MGYNPFYTPKVSLLDRLAVEAARPLAENLVAREGETEETAIAGATSLGNDSIIDTECHHPRRPPDDDFLYEYYGMRKPFLKRLFGRTVYLDHLAYTALLSSFPWKPSSLRRFILWCLRRFAKDFVEKHVNMLASVLRHQKAINVSRGFKINTAPSKHVFASAERMTKAPALAYSYGTRVYAKFGYYFTWFGEAFFDGDFARVVQVPVDAPLELYDLVVEWPKDNRPDLGYVWWCNSHIPMEGTERHDVGYVTRVVERAIDPDVDDFYIYTPILVPEGALVWRIVRPPDETLEDMNMNRMGGSAIGGGQGA